MPTSARRSGFEGLSMLMAGRTSITIAHRLATVRNADRIFVLDEGRIVESGSHAELLKAGGLYARLYRIQFRTHEGSELPPLRRANQGNFPAAAKISLLPANP